MVTGGWGVVEGERSWGPACLCVISDPAVYLPGNLSKLLNPSQSPFAHLLNGDNNVGCSEIK